MDKDAKESAFETFVTLHPPSLNPGDSAEFHYLALRVAHNLRFYHNWSDVRLHTISAEYGPHPRPLVTGIPPSRVYVHPDEQIEALQKHKDQGKTGMPELAPEREWVLPSHLREKWSLRRLGNIFDTIAVAPTGTEGEALFENDRAQDNASTDDQECLPVWRAKLPKRLLLSTVDDDSTVVYYIVHDGVVKPRQN